MAKRELMLPEKGANRVQLTPVKRQWAHLAEGQGSTVPASVALTVHVYNNLQERMGARPVHDRILGAVVAFGFGGLAMAVASPAVFVTALVASTIAGGTIGFGRMAGLVAAPFAGMAGLCASIGGKVRVRLSPAKSLPSVRITRQKLLSETSGAQPSAIPPTATYTKAFPAARAEQPDSPAAQAVRPSLPDHKPR